MLCSFQPFPSLSSMQNSKVTLVHLSFSSDICKTRLVENSSLKKDSVVLEQKIKIMNMYVMYDEKPYISIAVLCLTQAF